MDRRNFMRVTALAAAGTMTQVSPQQNGPRPNIVLIYADDLGYSDIGCFGSTETRTPFLDRMASQGAKLTQFYATSPVCCPSRSGLLTGRYPSRNGLHSNIRNDRVNDGYRYSMLEYACSPEMTLGLDLKEVTIAEPLKKAGYRTGIVGKWDSGRAKRFLPLQRGFDFFYGFANTGIDYWTHERYGVPSMFSGNDLIKEEGYATELFQREAIRFIEDNQNRPFFLYLPLNSPHGPSNLERTGPQAPDEYIRLYGEPPGSAQIRYRANITCMDAAIGAILGKVSQLGLEDNTLIVFASDNGAVSMGSNAPFRGLKGQMYEGGIRIPAIARWPGRIPAGIESNEFCSTLDLFPTFLSLAQADRPAGIDLDGSDIFSVFSTGGKSHRQEHFWELRGSRAARMENWKWVVETGRFEIPSESDSGELFDLSSDKEEKHNLAKERPEVLRQIRERWNDWMDEVARGEFRGPFSKEYFRLLGFPRS